MSKKKPKHPHHMTTEEAVKHLFHKDVIKHATKGLTAKDRKKKATKG